MKPLVFLGGGGHSTALADVVRSAGLRIAGVLSNDAESTGNVVRLGNDGWLDRPASRDHDYLIAVGQVGVSPLRARLFAELVSRGLEPARVVASDAHLAEGSTIGAGTVLMHRAVVGPAARIGDNCIVNTGAIVEHDVVVGDHCHVSTGAILNGGVRLGNGTMVGSGAVVLQQVAICHDVMIGAGSLVTEDIRHPGVYVGSPVRKIK